MDRPLSPLSALRDIHLPGAPAEVELLWLWLLIAASLAALVVTGLALYRSRLPHWRGPALEALATVPNADPAESVTACARVLRQIVIANGGDTTLAQQTGESWLETLDQTFSSRYFTTGAGRVFGTDLYRPSISVDPATVAADLQRLVRRARRAPPWQY